MISEYPLAFGLYDVVSGIAGDLYYLLDCDDILSDTKSLLKIKEILNNKRTKYETNDYKSSKLYFQ